MLCLFGRGGSLDGDWGRKEKKKGRCSSDIKSGISLLYVSLLIAAY